MSLKLLSLPKVKLPYYLYNVDFDSVLVVIFDSGEMLILTTKDWLCSPINPMRFRHMKPIEIP